MGYTKQIFEKGGNKYKQKLKQQTKQNQLSIYIIV